MGQFYHVYTRVGEFAPLKLYMIFCEREISFIGIFHETVLIYMYTRVG